MTLNYLPQLGGRFYAPASPGLFWGSVASDSETGET